MLLITQTFNFCCLSLRQPTPLTSLHDAAKEGDFCTVEYLVEHGADVNDTDNNGVNVTILLADNR